MIKIYISKLELNSASYRVQKELSNLYQLHRTIMKAFPDNLKEKNEKERILFRIEKQSDKHYPSILVQSTLCPDWDFLIKDDNFLLKNPLFKQFNYPRFIKGNKFWFRLFANPTKKVDKKRIGTYNEELIYEWLKKKAVLGGFDPLHVNIIGKEEITAKVNKNSKTMTFYGIRFEGVLQVVESERFEAILKNGIGSGKAFGFGLLSISNI